jgi:hypothetical protein
MIDIELLKPGNTVCVVHNNRPQSFVSQRIDRLTTSNGTQINITGGAFSIPADKCFFSEMELIEDQINYWRDMRLNKIIQGNL